MLKSLTISSTRYLQRLGADALNNSSEICITEIDEARLRNLALLKPGTEMVAPGHESSMRPWSAHARWSAMW